MAAEREGAVVTRGHDEGMKAAAALLEEFGLPPGLLPLEDVTEVGFVRGTGYFWLAQRGRVEHRFRRIGKQVRYGAEIAGYIQPRGIKKLRGVRAKELVLWPPVTPPGTGLAPRRSGRSGKPSTRYFGPEWKA